MIKIAIIEDEQAHTELLSSYLRTWGTAQGQAVSIQTFLSAESFLFVWEETNDFDILFVDIQMGKMNGVEMAEKVRECDREIAIVFTTGIADYMGCGYEVEALHYLLKPISKEKVGQCMDKVMQRSCREAFALVHGREETMKIAVGHISYVEARGHGCVMETCARDGSGGQVEIAESISEMERQLGSHGFIRCHRSYLCRIESICRIGKTEITLDSGSVIPVSRRMYAEVNRAFIAHFRQDYHNHIQTMKAHLAMGKLEELETYLNELDHDLTTVDTVIKTGNVMVDAILNSKISVAASKGMAVEAKAVVPEKLDTSLSEADVCLIVGNLMDNAIEACMIIRQEGQRFIRVYIDILKGQFYIYMINAIGENPKKAGGVYLSDKNAGSHGFGLMRIDKVVDKYHGYLERQHEEGVFATEIMLPL